MMRQTIFEKRKKQTPKMTFVFVLTCELELAHMFVILQLVANVLPESVKGLK